MHLLGRRTGRLADLRSPGHTGAWPPFLLLCGKEEAERKGWPLPAWRFPLGWGGGGGEVAGSPVLYPPALPGSRLCCPTARPHLRPAMGKALDP